MSCGKREGHVDAGVGPAERLAVERSQQRQMQLAVTPGGAEFVRRHGDGGECRRRLAVEEAETLGQLGRDEIAQRDVVDQHQEPDVACGAPRRRDAHRHVAGDDGDLAFEVDAPGLVGHFDADRAGPRKASDPPWYISGSVQKLAGISAPRALRTSST